jgi:hypothetical protein
MRIIAATALVALSLVAAPSFYTNRAIAADNVTVGIGNGGIAFGYSDGYWDRGHKWHNWENREAAERFRSENREHYYERTHDRDRDEGWRENERYWERR